MQGQSVDPWTFLEDDDDDDDNDNDDDKEEEEESVSWILGPLR